MTYQKIAKIVHKLSTDYPPTIHKVIHRLFTFCINYPQCFVDNFVDNYFLRGRIFFCNISMVFARLWDVFISFSIFSAPCMTVVWSLFPIAFPIVASGTLVILRHKYMAICRGRTILLLRFVPQMSSSVTSKCSATIEMMYYGVMSFFSFGAMMSLSTCSARATLISRFSRLARAISLFRDPSSSRIFDFTFDAIYWITSSLIW